MQNKNCCTLKLNTKMAYEPKDSRFRLELMQFTKYKSQSVFKIWSNSMTKAISNAMQYITYLTIYKPTEETNDLNIYIII